MSKLNYKETKSLAMRWLALSTPTLAILGLLSGFGGGLYKTKRIHRYHEENHLKFYETASLSVRV
jgi:hypothetical protein